MARFNAEGTGKTALVATNGGLWMSKNYQVRELGQEANCVYPEYSANVKTGYNIPWGYNMYGDEYVNLSDVTQIMKMIAGWDVSVDDTADYNGDGNISLADVTAILRHIAG